MDCGSRNGIQANEKIDSGVAYVNRTKRERGINHLPGGCKGSHQCSPNDRKRREISAHLLRQPCITRSGNQLHSIGEADTCSDGSSCIDGSGAGLILTNPEGKEFTYALRFRFDATNNEAEYEALIAGLRIAGQMGVKILQANVDSRLVANQVNGTYIKKEQGMIKYLEKRPEDDPFDTPMEDKEELPDPWILFTDGSSCIDGSGSGLILTNPEGTEFTYALRFRFDTTNNEA
ncbi:reverse transcriptase domain-containing protein [Tanacetum coccineum]